MAELQIYTREHNPRMYIGFVRGNAGEIAEIVRGLFRQNGHTKTHLTIKEPTPAPSTGTNRRSSWREWTPEEDSLVLAQNTTTRQLSKKIHRTKSAIWSRRHLLLHRPSLLGKHVKTEVNE